MASCADCGKEFDNKGSFDQHFSAKHVKKPESPVYRKKSRKPVLAIAVVVLLVLAVTSLFLTGSGANACPVQPQVKEINLDEVPKIPIHWHPIAKIKINGENIVLPNIGSSGDYHGPGIIHQPVHTHDKTGKLHLEMNNPTPETMVLGFFFHTVWNQTFNGTCISDLRDPESGKILCNGPEGNLSMTVNGKCNYQFDRYIPKDLDNIRITFG